MERECPKCHKKQVFKSKSGFMSAIKNNRFCRSCSKTGEKNPGFGVFPSHEIRKKISEFHLGKSKSKLHKQKISESLIKSGLFNGEKNPFYGKKHNLQSRIKSSISQSGENSYWYGKKRSQETRRKMRVSKLKLLKENEIPANIDKGSIEYFNKLNKNGFNIIHPFYDFKVGYISDGYDVKNHIWFEFDTPYHYRLGQQNKDIKRQKEIIEYYKRINNPLTKFIRINSKI